MRSLICAAATCVATFLVALPARANQPPPDIATAFPDAMSWNELTAAFLVLIFAAMVFAVAILLKRWGGYSETAVVRLIALVLIVSSTLFLVVLGFSTEQIGAALGLLGTIAGYVLGRADRGKGGVDE